MNDLRFLGMKIVERVQELITPQHDLLYRERSLLLFHHLAEIFTCDKLHHQKLAFILGKMITYARQRRMMHSCKQPGLAFKLFPQTLVGKQRLLQSNRGIKTLVYRFVNCSHSALAELTNNAIATLQKCLGG